MRWNLEIARIILLVGAGTLFGFSGTAIAQPKASTGSSPSVADRLSDLEKKVESLSDMVGMLLRSDPPKLAWLDCADHKFREVRLSGSALSIFVSCDSIVPYLEGYKIKLSVGNPYSFDLDGVRGTLWHGQENYEAFKSQRKVDLLSVQRLRSGTWTPMEVAINPAKASEFREIAVEFSAQLVVPGRL